MKKEQWVKIDGKVDEAEKARRAALLASKELHEESGMPKEERKNLTEESVPTVRRKRVFEKASIREEEYEKEAEEILGDENSSERALVGLRKENLAEALKKASDIDAERAELLTEKAEIMETISGEPSGSEQEALLEIESDMVTLEKEKQELAASTPEAYYGLRLRELKAYKKSLEKKEMAETPYVKERMEDIASHLRAHKPVFIYGHLGAGKSEIAMHVARKIFGKEPLIISGSKYTTLAELFGHQVLAHDKIDEKAIEEFDRETEEKLQEWKDAHEGASEKETASAHRRIFESRLAGLKGGTISRFFKGPIYRGAEEGRVVIEDEVNAIPHEVLIAQNHILTRKAGDKVNVQQDSGEEIEIKDGFGVIMTGNLNQGEEKYVMRQDMDPAFLSRLYKIEYDYLPQSTDKPLAEAGERDELFHLLIAKMMDRNGNIEAPEDAMQKLWKLAEAARVTQDVFAGKEVSGAHYLKQDGGRSVRYFLKEAVLSPRAINDIIVQWQKEGYQYELDYYLWKEFVSQSTQAGDRAYLYQELKDRYGFFTSQGWNAAPNYGSGGVINSFDIGDVPKNPSRDKKFFGPRDVVDIAYGKGKSPERTKWPKAEGRSESKEKEPKPNEQRRFLEELRQFEQDYTEFSNQFAMVEREVEETTAQQEEPGGKKGGNAKKNPQKTFLGGIFSS
jgi:MoxR-like ATPase